MCVPSSGSRNFAGNHGSSVGHMRGGGGVLGSFMFRPLVVGNSFGAAVTLAVAVATVVTIAVVVTVAGVVALVEQQL